MKPLRDLGPAMDTFAMVAAGRAGRAAHGSADTRARTSATASCSASSPREAIDAFLAAAGPGSGSPLVSAEIRHLGGALPAAAAPRRPRARSTPTSSPSASGSCSTQDELPGAAGARSRPRRGVRSLRERASVPELHRGAHRPGAVLHAARVPQAARRSRPGVRPGEPDPGEPPDPSQLAEHGVTPPSAPDPGTGTDTVPVPVLACRRATAPRDACCPHPVAIRPRPDSAQ